MEMGIGGEREEKNKKWMEKMEIKLFKIKYRTRVKGRRGNWQQKNQDILYTSTNVIIIYIYM